ncbi:cation:proton antiporter [Arenibacterium halophilum]|uniref:Sodium:proton antiporter n=1 Tax=Arenibacterium halophilum TaxID=2583821 RepID=A0ABY2XBV3_9RHOB|nr:sodium:proton antiporter [Arenibacterium halophilum]TMV14496.1 sodium:proton antiporter [Arenibacterium halophilum]
MVDGAAGQMSPVMAIALVGALGVGAQWLAWRLKLPAIVLMLLAGILIGPVAGVFDPERDIGPLVQPMISIAVAIILFEGGLTLNLHTLKGVAQGVRRLVFVGAPLGWLLSTLALHYVAGLSWESSAVFGGIMVVTGPTVIAPLLRQARLSRKPAALLQWEAIVNDPIGAMAAVLAFEIVVLRYSAAESTGVAAFHLVSGILIAILVGVAAGILVAWAFRRGKVPEYMKVPVLFVMLLVVFTMPNALLHESGLLAVTAMGVLIANANLPSYDEMRRFKEHATILLVSGVFILLAAGLDFGDLDLLTWRAALFLGVVILLVRPATVLLSLIGSDVGRKERVLVALTGPRGVVLVAVAGLFGERLADLGVVDGALIAPLAFALVAATVVVHGFTLGPLARALGLTGAQRPGILLVGGSRWSTALAEAIKRTETPVLIADRNRGHLRPARAAGIPTFFGDILSELAELHVEYSSYKRLVCVTDNDAYNTLVATDLGPELGRDNVFQLHRENEESTRNSLPATLGGRQFAQGLSYDELASRHREGWEFRVTKLTEAYGIEEFLNARPEAVIITVVYPKGELRFPKKGTEITGGDGAQVVHFSPPKRDSADPAPQAAADDSR